MSVTLEELKEYLRIDTPDEDTLLEGFLATAESLCTAVARAEDAEDYASLGGPAKTAVLYAASYLYEHRDEADHRELTLTLRALLFGVRKETF